MGWRLVSRISYLVSVASCHLWASIIATRIQILDKRQEDSLTQLSQETRRNPCVSRSHSGVKCEAPDRSANATNRSKRKERAKQVLVVFTKCVTRSISLVGRSYRYSFDLALNLHAIETNLSYMRLVNLIRSLRVTREK